MTEDMQYDGPPPHDPTDEIQSGDMVTFWMEGKKYIGLFAGCEDGYWLIDGGAGVLMVMSDIKLAEMDVE